jgi:methionyl-tRNA synthetase
MIAHQRVSHREPTMGACPRCGWTGVLGKTCEDCGCADYEPKESHELEDKIQALKARGDAIQKTLDSYRETDDSDTDDYPF